MREGQAPDSAVLTATRTDPQGWMALLRREIGHFHEKKDLPTDARWAWAWEAWAGCRQGHWVDMCAYLPASGGLTQNRLLDEFSEGAARLCVCVCVSRSV